MEHSWKARASNLLSSLALIRFLFEATGFKPHVLESIFDVHRNRVSSRPFTRPAASRRAVGEFKWRTLAIDLCTGAHQNSVTKHCLGCSIK